jgi:fucose 4-O-acetylase-like acetyltransferase
MEYKYYEWEDVVHEIRNITIGMTTEEPLAGAMWFCPALLVVSILSAIAIKWETKQTTITKKIGVLFFFPVLGCLLCSLQIKSPRCLWEYMQICSIFCAGFYFKKINERIPIINSQIIMGVIIVISILMILTLNDFGVYANLQPTEIRKENIFVIGFIGSCAGVSVYCLAKIIYQYCQMSSSLLAFIGDHSFTIMAMHFVSFKVVSLLYCFWHDKPIELLSTFPNIRNIGLGWTILYITAGVFLPLLPTICYNQITPITDKVLKNRKTAM